MYIEVCNTKYKIVFLSSIFFILISTISYASDMKSSLQHISNTLNIEILMEEDLASETALNVPQNIDGMEPKQLIDKCLKGYSHAVLFDGDSIKKVWVYKSGTGSFTRLTALEDMHDSSHELSSTDKEVGQTHTSGSSIPTLSPKKVASPGPHNGLTQSYTGHTSKKNSFGYHKPVNSKSLSSKVSKNQTSPMPHAGYTSKDHAIFVQKQQQDLSMTRSAFAGHLEAGVKK